MSPGDSEYTTESGRRDSAYSPQPMQGPSLARLRSHDVHPTIEDWSHLPDTAGPKFAVQAYTFPEGPASVPRSLPLDTSSMTPLTLQNLSDFGSVYPESVPSLASSSSVASRPSLSSSAAGSVGQIYRLDPDGEEDEDLGTTQHPGITSPRPAFQKPITPCLFSFLGCQQSSFLNAEHWYEHSKTHFRGHPPPSTLRCPYTSCPWGVSSRDGEEAWAARWEHLEGEHDVLVDGEKLREKRDPLLYKHLWKDRVITDAQLQELRSFGQLGSNRQPYVTTEKAPKSPRRQRKPPSSRPEDPWRRR